MRLLTSELVLAPTLGVPPIGALVARYPAWAYMIAGGLVTATHVVDVAARRRAWDQESRARGRHAMARGRVPHRKSQAA